MPEQIFKYSVGCDISKDAFNVCILEVSQDMQSKVKASHKFKNETKGFKEFDAWVKKHKKHAVQTDQRFEQLQTQAGELFMRVQSIQRAMCRCNGHWATWREIIVVSILA